MARSRRHRPDPMSEQYDAFIAKLSDEQTLAYLDETFRRDGAHGEYGFYSVAVFLCQASEIDSYRSALFEIVGNDYWHTTEALRDGQTDTVEQLLAFMNDQPTMNVIVHTTEVTDASDAALEDARQEVLTELFTSLSDADPNLRGFVTESRRNQKDNNADRATFKRLQDQRLIPYELSLQFTSPTTDNNLWLPDIAAMAYRRTITHQDHESGQWFGRFLERFSFITLLPDAADPAALREWVAQVKDIQALPDDPRRQVPKAPAAPTPAAIADFQRQRLSIQRQIETQPTTTPTASQDARSPAERIAQQVLLTTGHLPPPPAAEDDPVAQLHQQLSGHQPGEQPDRHADEAGGHKAHDTDSPEL